MCECGCSMNGTRYKFPGPGRAIYILSLLPACDNCCVPSGVSVERITPDNIIYKEYARGEFTDGDLPFGKWADNEGVAIITGLQQHEFVEALKSHLIGLSSEEMGENGLVDEAGAQVILEEMYEDAQVTPHLVQRQEAVE